MTETETIIYDQENLRIVEYATLSDGRKHYQISWRTPSFTHHSVLAYVEPNYQSVDTLVASAKQRLAWQ